MKKVFRNTAVDISVETGYGMTNPISDILIGRNVTIYGLDLVKRLFLLQFHLNTTLVKS